MVNRYSLADHTVVVKVPDLSEFGYTNFQNKPLTFGGAGQNNIEGSFVGGITVSRANDTWTTDGDPTGSWVHNKNLNRTGTVQLTLRQISDDVVYLMMLAQIFENNPVSVGMNIIVYSGKEIVAEATDCYLVKIPDQTYGETAETQQWTWTAGRVTFPRTADWANKN